MKTKEYKPVDFEKELKKRKFKKKVSDVVYNSLEFVNDHKEDITKIMAVATPTIVVTKKIVKKASAAHERSKIDHRYYDHSTQSFIQLKRKLNNKDIQRINERKADGLKMYDILNEMNVIK